MADDLGSIFRRESGRCIATLIRLLGDIDLAEDAVAEAFTIAAERWLRDGIPPNPGAWITATARNRAIDRLRREATRLDRYRSAHHLRPPDMTGHDEDHGDDHAELGLLDDLATVVPDDQLRLLFLCCHPALSADARVALSLRLLGGLATDEIAAAFVVSEATMAKRIVRAKSKLRHNNAAYRIPSPAELPDRLFVVLTVVYLIYTQGHRATAGPGLVRGELRDEAIRLARLIDALMPDEPEATGLLALLLLTEARSAARLDPAGNMVRLADQDRGMWDGTLIGEGHDLVRRCLKRNRPGSFQIQAAIAAVHADAPSYAATDWGQIVALYDQLLAVRPSAVVEVNRAVAVAEVHGVEAGLAALDRIEPGSLLDAFQPFHAVRADLLQRAGRHHDAIAAYAQALALTTTVSETRFLSEQRAISQRAISRRDVGTAAPRDV